MFKISFGPHATVHGATGGTFGCDVLDEFVRSGDIRDQEAAYKLCTGMPFLFKKFYRMDVLQPKKNCKLNTEDYSSSLCGFTCDFDERDEVGDMIQEWFKDEIDLTKYGVVDRMVDFICSGNAYKIFPGDALESASPADPSFWVIHPTLERLFQAKLFSGGFEDATWPDDSQADFVCTGNYCSDAETGERGYHATCCDGHYANSRLLNGYTGDRTDHIGQTNGAVLDNTDPTSKSYKNKFIYDNFKWEHCYGPSDINNLLKGRYKSSRQSQLKDT